VAEGDMADISNVLDPTTIVAVLTVEQVDPVVSVNVRV
jgi:hypothetical protein